MPVTQALANWQRHKIQQAREHQIKAFDEVNELVIEERKGRQIVLDDGCELVEFVSCSYLGLDQDPRVIEAASASLAKCGVTFPAARTRIKVKSFVALEELLNEILCGGHSTIFASLHLGTLGLLPLLGSGEMPSFPLRGNGPRFILDKSVHASIQINRGLMQQFGEVALVDFQQPERVEEEFRKAQAADQSPIALADSIGSMGGVAPVTDLMQWCERYGGYAYLDDAHGTSVYGRHGCGYVLDQLDNEFHPRLALASSLAKAFGAVAGVIALPTREDEQMVKRFASTYIFGGPPPIAIIDSAIAAARIHLSDEIYLLQERLRSNMALFDSNIEGHIVNRDTTAPIRGVLVGDEFRAIEFTRQLRQAGFAVTTAMYPTVAMGKAMLRVALSAAHEESQVLSLCSRINGIGREINPA